MNHSEKAVSLWHRAHRWRVMLMIVLILLFLPGCWDMREVEHLFYVNAIGVDYQGGNFIVYAQIINPQTIGRQQGGVSTNVSGEWVGVGRGPTVLDAIHNIYATSQRRVFWGHVTTILLSERELASAGISPVVDVISRYHEWRYLAWVYCTDQPVQTVLETQPVLEKAAIFSLLSDPLNTYAQSSVVRPNRLYRMIANVQEPARPSLITEVTLNHSSWFDAKENYPEPMISGVAILHSGKMVGRLERKDLKGLAWYSPDTQRLLLNVHGDEETMASLILGLPKHHAHPVFDGKNLTFSVDIKVQGYIAAQSVPVPQDRLEQLAAREIEHDIRKTFATGLQVHSDVLGLADSLYRRHPQAYKTWNRSGGIDLLTPASLKQVNVTVKLQHSGRSQEPSSHYKRNHIRRPTAR